MTRAGKPTLSFREFNLDQLKTQSLVDSSKNYDDLPRSRHYR
ncbi:MAG: hypothetical protein AAF808_22285 [Cyanobacteria bacterium P01_D01_bin.2]